MRFKCPTSGCEEIFNVADEMAGKKGQCPSCDKTFTIPTPPAKQGQKGPGKTAPKSSAPDQQKAQESQAAANAAKEQARKKAVAAAKAKKEAAAKQAAAKRAAAKKAQARKQAAAKSAAQSKRKKSPPKIATVSEDDFLDDDDFMDDDDDMFGGGTDDFGSDDDFLGGDDDSFGGGDSFGGDEWSTPQQQSGRTQKPANWGNTRTGLFILAITMCVVAGSHVIFVLGQALSQGGIAYRSSFQRAYEDYRERQSEIREQYNLFDQREQYQAAMKSLDDEFASVREAAAGAGETTESLMDTAVVMWRISYGLKFATMVAGAAGFIFLVLGPNRGGTRGLAISILTVAVANLVILGIWQVWPIVVDGKESMLGNEHHGRSFMEMAGAYPPAVKVVEESSGIFGSRTSRRTSIESDSKNHAIYAMLMDISRATEFLLLAIFMSLVASATKDKTQSKDMLKLMGVVIAFMVFLMFTYIFGMVGWRSSLGGSGGSTWAFYVTRLFGWGTELIFGVVLVLFIMNLFYMRKRVK